MRDITRNKCHFMLAFCAVTVVILTSLVIQTLIDKGPIVFLKVAELQVGNYDGQVVINDKVKSNYNSDSYYLYSKRSLNYTQIMNVTENDYNLSPRMYSDRGYLKGFSGDYLSIYAIDTMKEN